MHTRISLILIVLSAGLSNFSKAQDETNNSLAEITGTITNLICVYNHRNNLSLGRLINPVPIFVKACPWNYPKNIPRPPASHLVPPKLIAVPFEVPPVDQWPLFTLVQLDQLGCHLKVWKQKNPTFKLNDIVTIDLRQPCNKLNVDLSNFSKAQDKTRDSSAEITGTITNLTCVYNNRNDLSLERRVNPVPIFVKACPWNYPKNIPRPPASHLVPPKLIAVPFEIPPVDQWPLFTLVQLDQLGCHLKVWKQKNPTFKLNDIVTIDLRQPCNEQ